jgi:hypothetical protein
VYDADTAGTIIVDGDTELNVAGENDVSALNYLNSRTTGTITASFTSTSISDLIDLEGSNAYTITLIDTQVNAAELKTLNASTTGNITLSSSDVTVLSGGYSDIFDIYSAIAVDDNQIIATNSGSLALVVSESITVGQANILSAKTDGAVTATITNMTMSELAL